MIGHLLGLAECALCDITHSPVRSKPECDRFVARLGVPFVVLHRNELDDALSLAIHDQTLPLVLAHRLDGSIEVVLTAEQLAEVGGSVERFTGALAGPEHSPT